MLCNVHGKGDGYIRSPGWRVNKTRVAADSGASQKPPSEETATEPACSNQEWAHEEDKRDQKNHDPNPTNHARHPLCYDPDFEEKRENQQYFYSRKTAQLLIDAIFDFFEYDEERISKELCCLCVPSIAEIFHHDYDISVTLLDFDTRFSYLPGYRHFDLLNPSPTSAKPRPYSMVLFDPPYFGISYEALRAALGTVADPKTRVLMNFVKRDEHILLREFPQLARTNTVVEYDRVRDSRWSNYGLYANCDLRGVKRVHEKGKPKGKK